MANTRTRADEAAQPEQAPAKPITAPATQPDTKTATAAVENTAVSAPTDGDVNPAQAALDDAVRKGETERLTKERDELRDAIGEAPTLVMLRAEVDALRQIAARAGVSFGRVRMSAGVASDLETLGHAVDPANGDVYVRDGDTITVTARSGEVRTVDMPRPSTASSRSE